MPVTVGTVNYLILIYIIILYILKEYPSKRGTQNHGDNGDNGDSRKLEYEIENCY